MKRIREGIAFCMVLLLLLGLAGCAEPTPSSSAPPSSSSEQSSLPELEPEIEPYVITPLDTPMNGGMTYEEYFSIERAVKSSEYLTKEINGELYYAWQTNRFFGKMGIVYHTDHEIYWLGDNGEGILIRRTAKKVHAMVAYEDVLIWQEYTCEKVDGVDIMDREMHRMYIPQMRHEVWATVHDGKLTTIGMPDGASTTDIKIIQTVAREKHEQGGYSEKQKMYIYSSLTDNTYEVEFSIFDDKVREQYLPIRDRELI